MFSPVELYFTKKSTVSFSLTALHAKYTPDQPQCQAIWLFIGSFSCDDFCEVFFYVCALQFCVFYAFFHKAYQYSFLK